ncbi:hypothetical protein BJY04DRAFT_180849 [Aspergillus karnatakaensis]|uniref:uncharacterized protein n=1 Tax=Aspergillus karnatakaensis TaxID=1810916 RepID=UPI003CCD8AAC
MELLTPSLDNAADVDYEMALATARFEKEYNQVHARTLQLLDGERDRARCVEQLLLCIENERIQLQLNQVTREVLRAREGESDARLQVEGTARELERLQYQAKISAREIENLRRELASLNAVAAESQKLQTDRVRLSKEVSIMQAEVERLKSQSSTANALLAEKQDLTRQLIALKEQLESEKRAHERTLAKESQQTNAVAALTLKLEEARREIELVRRPRQDPHLRPKTASSLAQESPFAEKMVPSHRKNPALSKGLRKEDTSIQQQQEDWGSTTTVRVSTERPRGNISNTLDRLHSELTIATPGAVRVQDQQKRSSTLPGDKSSFSITPFLNRTTGPEESSSSDDELNGLHNANDSGQTKDLLKTTNRGSSTTTLSEQLKQQIVKQTNKPAQQGLAKGALEEDTRVRQKSKIWDSPDESGSQHAQTTRLMGQKQAITKKRKLGLQRDRSLFDEDEEDVPLQDAKKAGRKLAGMGTTGLTGSSRIFTGPVGFSPLKRDKKRS